MARIFDGMKAFFDADNWNTHQLDGQLALQMGFDGEAGRWSCFAQAREEQEQLVFYSVAPVKAPEERRAQVTEFITRANFGMIIGSFELDLSDGEVRYKTAVDFEDLEVSIAQVRNMVYPNVLTMDRYLKGIISVSFGGAEALAAIQEIEAVPPEEREVVPPVN